MPFTQHGVDRFKIFIKFYTCMWPDKMPNDAISNGYIYIIHSLITSKLNVIGSFEQGDNDILDVITE